MLYSDIIEVLNLDEN